MSINFSQFKKLSIDNVELRKLYLDNYHNLVPTSTNNNGSGFGYIDGYRLNSSGGQTAQVNTATSGFISCKSTSIIRMAGTTWLTGGSSGDDYTYLQYYDSNYQLLGSINANHSGSGGIYGLNTHGDFIDKEASSITVNTENVTTFQIAFLSGVDASKVAYCRLSGIGKGKDMVVTIDEEISTVLLWEATAAFTNQVPISTDADGNIYNGTGIKYKYRVRSGGAEGSQNGAACTGFIPCKAGQTIRVMDASGKSIWYATSTSCAINFSDSTKTNLGQIVGNSIGYGTCEGLGKLDDIVTRHSNNMWEYTVPNTIGNVAYIRLTVYYNYVGENKLDLIVTIDEEITE